MRKKRILIADDTELFILTQVSFLDPQHFDIFTARSGSETLEKACTMKPDLIMLDMYMQDMNGDDVCRILKREPDTSSITIIITSPGGEEPSTTRMVLAGGDGIVFKPFRRDQYIALIERFLGVSVRYWSRAKIALPCRVIWDNTIRDGMIHSLSGGGAFVEWPFNLLPGNLCGLEFILPGQDKTIFVRNADVVWTGKLDETGPKGFGVNFLTIDSGDRTNIDSIVRH